MDSPPVPKPRSAFLPQNEPLTRPIPVPRTKLPQPADRVTASDIFKSISTVSKQLSEDVALKVSNSAKTANEKLEKSILDGSKFAKDTLEKTLTTSRAVRHSVTKSVIEGTRTAGLRLRRTKKPDGLDEIDPQRCVSMPAVDVSLFDNIQFNSPLLEQKRFHNEEAGVQKNQEHPNLQLNTSNFDDLSLFSSNSDNTDSVSSFSYDMSRELEQNASSLTLETEQMTYDIPKPSRANSIVSSMSSTSIGSCPEAPERRKKRESGVSMEVMRQNSMYENWTLPFQSSASSTPTKEVEPPHLEPPRASKSTIYEFDPLQSSTSSQKYDGVSNELLLLESFLIGDTYGTIVASDNTDDSFEFYESEYFNPPTPPERSDSLFTEPKPTKLNVVDKDRNSNWFVTNETDAKLVTDDDIKDDTKSTHSVMQKFSHMLKFEKLNKTSKPVPQKVECIERPQVNSLPVPYYSGLLTRIVSGVVEDLFKNSQTRYCVLSDQKLMCYSDPTNSILKEAYTLDNIYSVQIVLPLSSSTTSNSYCFELTVSSGGMRSSPRKILFSCASASERRNWAQKIAEHLTCAFATKYTSEFTRCGWCYLKNAKLVSSSETMETSSLVIEAEIPIIINKIVEGRRIIDFNYFLDQIKIINNHNRAMGCTIDNLELLKERKVGLQSTFTMKCNMCNLELQLFSSNSSNSNMDVNRGAVTGAMMTGFGRSNLNELLASIDLPILTQNTYAKCHDEVAKWWRAAAEDSMLEAAKEEAAEAIACGEVKDNIPILTVIADCCWSKRSYKTNYSAMSGVAAIIGYKTGKVLYMDVKNKYCIVCARAAVKGEPPANHNCHKNHSGSSSSMEQSVIVEGFKTSVARQNVIYGTLIADGDASTFKKILESRPYPNYQVNKIECTNHLLRNYCGKILNVSKDTSIPLNERRLLTADRQKRLRTAVKCAIRYRKAQNLTLSEQTINLKKDILNSPMHIFGDHNACESYYCSNNRKDEENLVPKVRVLINKIMGHTAQIAFHSKSLLHNITNNRAEQFNSIVAKLVGGKRVNFSLKSSYTARCHAAVVSFNSARPQYNIYKSKFNKSPGMSLKRIEMARLKRIQKGKSYRRPRRRLNFEKEKTHYGEECQRPDMSADDYDVAKNIFLENLQEQEGVTGEWRGAWVMLIRRVMVYYTSKDPTVCTVDLRKTRCVVTQEADEETKSVCPTDGSDNLLLDCPHATLYLRFPHERELKGWRYMVKLAAHNNGAHIHHQQLTKEDVPAIVDKCLSFIYAHGSLSEGIYRRAGSSSVLSELLARFRRDAWSVQLSPSQHSEHDAAGVLKRFFRDLPEPLVPQEKHQDLISALEQSDETTRHSDYRRAMASLPLVAKNTARKLFAHLHFLHTMSHANKMNAENLASVWAPTIMPAALTSNTLQTAWSTKEVFVVRDLIANFEAIWEPTDAEKRREAAVRRIIMRVLSNSAPSAPKAAGDLRAWVYVNDKSTCYQITLTPNKTSSDICTELCEKAKTESHLLMLEEVICNESMRRVVHIDEVALDVVLRWSYWDEDDRKHNYLLVTQNKILHDMEALRQTTSVCGELRLATETMKSFKLHMFEVQNSRLCYFKDKQGSHKIEEWKIKDILWYVGHEPKRNPQSRWAITFIPRNKQKRSKDRPWFGCTIAGAVTEDQLKWMTALMFAEHSVILPTPRLVIT